MTEYCPTCHAKIVCVTRGIPSIGTCSNGHQTDRREVLNSLPVNKPETAEPTDGGPAFPHETTSSLTPTDAREARDRAIAEAVEKERELWRRNSIDTWSAMQAMRNDINEYIPLPSMESDLLESPEASVFCARVAEAVCARIASLEAQLAEAQALADPEAISLAYMAGADRSRPTVEAFNEEQVRIWAQEILEALAMHDQYQPDTYEDKILAGQLVERELSNIGKTVAARPTVGEAAAQERFMLEWIAGARPPAHPEKMTGRQSFPSFDDALTFFRSLAADAEFVSLHRETRALDDVSSTALRDLSEDTQ